MERIQTKNHCLNQLEQENQNITQENASIEVDDNDGLKSGQNSVISDALSNHANENDQFDSLVKTAKKIVTKPKAWGCKISAEIKAKMEEEKALKNECDKLEYEVMQSEKLQNSIDRYCKKICDLKKEGDDKQTTLKSTRKPGGFMQSCFFFLVLSYLQCFLVYLLQYLKDTINIIPQTTKRYAVLCENRVTQI